MKKIQEDIIVEQYLEELNDAQREAVECILGASMVIAGAGSGKTRVLTYRIAHILNQGVRAHEILALTFTNKAAKEMKSRIASIVGNDVARNLWMGTFHSIFSKILRMEAENLGFTSNYTIYDTSDSKSLIKNIVKEMGLDDKIYKVSDVLGRISAAKNNLIVPAVYSTLPEIYERDKGARKPQMGEIYKTYTDRCRKADAMDFDDLLLYTNILFRDFPQILEKYQKHFNYILVDEYQDTNYSQYLIVKKLAEKHRNICVVGDDAQSIYSFRGAKIENILNFKNDYPDYKLFKLEQNYRSTQNIVDAANSIIANNKRQIPKNVFSKNEIGSKIKVLRAKTDGEEGFLIANSIMDSRMSEHFDFEDYAILYRTNAQSRIFEESLRKKNIPYKIYGGLSFYQRKEIKDLLSYFRLSINIKDEEALKRVINYPARGIGDTTINKIQNLALESECSMWEILVNLDNIPSDINRGTRAKLSSFVRLISDFSQKLKTMDAYDFALTIANTTGILNELKFDKTPENVSRCENVEELMNGIKSFISDFPPEAGLITLDHYMENVALLTDQDTEKSEDQNKVTLMTIHSAKGLEFKNIYIVGVEEDLFPSHLSSTIESEIEEERRLFYVAITRAKVNATISYAETRYKWGTPTNCTASRFIGEIDPGFLELPEDDNFVESGSGFEPKDESYQGDEGSRTRFEKKPFQKAAGGAPAVTIPRKLINMKEARHQNQQNDHMESADASMIQVGMKVEHDRFGVGKVLNLEGTAPNIKATVFFQNAGQKQLLLKFAKLRIIETI
ncbi:MAG: 3'-5' exonuclease [Bacteroidota bacterium]|nr:3'-5' exonuclease [Bacteroidota bacterium]